MGRVRLVTAFEAGDRWRNASLLIAALRFDSSVITWRRKASKPVEIAGVSIPQGANLLLALCSGNRDDAHFPEPERFDLDRANAKTICRSASASTIASARRSRGSSSRSYLKSSHDACRLCVSCPIRSGSFRRILRFADPRGCL